MLRIEHDYMQKEVADKIGCSVGMLSSYEGDRREPNTETLCKLAEFYDVSVDYLVGKSLEKNPGLQSDVPDWVANLPQDLQNFIKTEAQGQFVFLRIAQNAKINDLPPQALIKMVEAFKEAFEDDKKAVEAKKNRNNDY